MAKKRKKRKTPTLDLPLFDLPMQAQAVSCDVEDAALAAGDVPQAGDELATSAPATAREPDELPDDDLPEESVPEAVDLAVQAHLSEDSPVQHSLFETEEVVDGGVDSPPTVAGSEEEEILASWSERLRAGLADLLMHVLMLAVAITVAYRLGVELRWSFWPPFAGLALIFSFLYWMVPVAFWGQTPGMAWVGQAARSVGDEPLTFYQAFLRWAGALITTALAGLPQLLSLKAGGSLSDRLSESKTVSL